MAPDSSFPVPVSPSRIGARLDSRRCRPSRRSLADVLRSHARARPDSLAFADGDVALTWSEAATARPPRAPTRCGTPGVGPGDRVLWLGQNSFRIQELLARVLRDRGDVLPGELAPAARRARVRDRRSRTRGRRLAGGGGRRDRAGRPGRGATTTARWIRHDADGDRPGAMRASTRSSSRPATADDPDADASADAPLLLVYTAAFDGRPNAAMLPSRALIAQGLLMAPWSGIDDRYVFLNSGPLFHIGTFMPNLSTFVMGGTNVFVRRSDGEELCRRDRALRRARAGSSSARWSTRSSRRTPTAATTSRRSAAGAATRRSTRGCSPTPSPWGRRRRWLRPVRGDGHGDVQPPRPRRHRHRTAGRRRSSTCASSTPTTTRSRPGETGEIVVRGATVMCGYWNRPELNAAPVARRLAPHQRPRPLRGRRLVHVRRTEGADAEVGGREHLPGRGRELPEDASGGRRLRGDRRARPDSGSSR